MVKKIFKWVGIVIGIILVIIIAASIVLMAIIDEKLVASQMEKALNRHVTIKKLDIGIFAIASGIEVKEIRISNYKTKDELAALKDKPVRDSDLFAGLKAFNFKVKLLQLLKGKVVLDELVLYEPVVNIVKNKKGVYNFDDLTKAKPAPAVKEAKEEKKKEAPKEKEKPKAEPSKPFSADDIPLEVSVGKIGIEKGNIKYTDESLGQVFQVYSLTALAHSIKIDPKDLKNKDSVQIKISMGLKTLGEVKTGTVKSFDIGFAVTGTVIPFDKKTRLLNPEADLKIGMPYGSITGLQIFEKLKSVDQLAKYSGKFDFLKKEITWKNAYVRVWYKDGFVKLKEGKIKTSDYTLTYEGDTNIKTKAVNLDMDMLLAEKYNEKIKSGIESNVKKLIPSNVAKYVKPEKITDAAMKSITNKDGQVDLKYEVTGKYNDPNVKFISPKLPSLKDLVKQSSGGAKEEVKQQAKEEVKQKTEETTKKAKEKATSKIKKMFK